MKAGEQRREEEGESGEVQVGTGEAVKIGAAYNECPRGRRGALRFTGFNRRCKYKHMLVYYTHVKQGFVHAFCENE